MEKYTYEGEKFLSMLYSDLHLKESVINSSNVNDKKLEKIKKYLDRQEEIHEKALEHNKLNLLKKAYYDKYVIKEIPEKYIEFLDKNNFNQTGYHLKEWEKTEHKKLIIEDQKKSLDTWIDYLTSEYTRFYPWWAKYWAFQGMLTIGAYNNEKESYGTRNDKTVAPFIELNQEVLSKSIDLIVKNINNEKIDESLKQIIDSKSFPKIYIELLKQHTKEKETMKETEGIWIKYEQGPNYKPLLESLQGHNTGWCTAGAGMCEKQVMEGDFYVYYTKDEQGEYKVPRLAIRMDGKYRIGEIRGIADGQNVESHLEDVLDKKLEEFSDKESYKRRINDSKILTYVYTKHQYKKELTKDDLKFIYEIEREIEGFGHRKDPRIEEIKSQRNMKKDMSFIYGIEEKEIALNKGELEKGENIKAFVGDLYYEKVTDAREVKIPKYVFGNLDLSNLTNAKGLENLELIKGNASFNSLIDSESLENLQTIEGVACFTNLMSAKGLKSLKKIGDNANFENLKNAEGLENLEVIEGDARFESLLTARGLENLKVIEGSARFESLTSAEGLENLESIGRWAKFEKLENATDLKKLKTIGATAEFRNLTNAQGLESLESIGETANFQKLTSAKGLENLKSIGRHAQFENLKNSEGLENLTYIGKDASFDSLEEAKGLKSLETIGEEAYFDNLTNAKGLESLKYIGKDAYFCNLVNAEGLENLEFIGKDAEFQNLQNAKGLKKLKVIEGDANFEILKDSEGLESLEKVNGSACFFSLLNAKDLTSLNTIGEEALFGRLPSAEGLENLKTIGNYYNFNSLTSVKGLENLETISGSSVQVKILFSNIMKSENNELENQGSKIR